MTGTPGTTGQLGLTGTPGQPRPAGKPSVLFVCVHNAGRSQLAAGWLRRLAGDRVEVRSAGSEPAESLNPAVVQVMRETGLELGGERPKLLTTDAVQASDVVISMGCGDSCPVFAGKRYLDWELPDPAGQGLDMVRRLSEDIRSRVQALLEELLGGAAPPFAIVPMTDEHAEAVLAIYQVGMDENEATFETTAPGWDDFRAAHLAEHSYVALDATGTVLGWVSAVAVSDRCVYAGVVEHSVYVHPDARGRGVGRALLTTLIDSTEAAGIWTVQSGIFPENQASAALHAAAGFRTVGRRERLAKQHGRWRDVVLIERRSPHIG
jgi:L-amino acid N-acyltransferase YncA/protein-tyrosine-phosphatase